MKTFYAMIEKLWFSFCIWEKYECENKINRHEALQCYIYGRTEYALLDILIGD